MSSEEDVILQIPYVKYKKDEGTLYIMSKRIAWIQENRDTVSLSHLYTDIKSQKISPEGKPKVQLQIILYDNTTFTFQFIHPDGQQAQYKYRNDVKERLIALLQKFKRSVNPELEEKNRLLKDIPGLIQLYRDLVTTEIISADEFWKDHAPKFINATEPITEMPQDVGISSGFLTGIQPSMDGVNGIIYNLTTDLIDSIFRTYPAVRKKHRELVPAVMEEKEFWAKFFQSHYFHRDRLPVSKDVFYSCAKADDKEMKKEVDVLRKTHKEIIALMGEKEQEEQSLSTTLAADEKTNESAAITAHRNMIKRFNQHSIMLLRASERNANPPPITVQADAKPNGEVVEPPKKKRKKERAEEEAAAAAEAAAEMEIIDPEVLAANAMKLNEKIMMGDLCNENPPDYQKLELDNVGRYLNGPVPVYQSNPVSLEEITRTVHMMRDVITRWNTKPYLLDSKMAATLIGDLSPGGAIMKTHGPETSSQVLPSEIEAELKNTYVALIELLRQFWSCFPATNPTVIEKLKRSHETIKKFEQIKLQQVRECLLRDHLPLTLLSHLNSIISAVDTKYSRWLSTNKPRR